jgi:hypothetical protein
MMILILGCCNWREEMRIFFLRFLWFYSLSSFHIDIFSYQFSIHWWSVKHQIQTHTHILFIRISRNYSTTKFNNQKSRWNFQRSWSRRIWVEFFRLLLLFFWIHQHNVIIGSCSVIFLHFKCNWEETFLFFHCLHCHSNWQSIKNIFIFSLWYFFVLCLSSSI